MRELILGNIAGISFSKCRAVMAGCVRVEVIPDIFSEKRQKKPETRPDPSKQADINKEVVLDRFFFFFAVSSQFTD